MRLRVQLPLQDLRELGIPAGPPPGEFLPRPGVNHVVDRQVGLPLDLLAVPQPQRLRPTAEPPALRLALLSSVQVVAPGRLLPADPGQVVLEIKSSSRSHD